MGFYVSCSDVSLRFWRANLGRSMIFCRVWGFLIEKIFLWFLYFQFMEFYSNDNTNMILNPWCQTSKLHFFFGS